MKIIKDFFTPPDLNQRELRFHTVLTGGLFIPIFYYSGLFVYFICIDVQQFLISVGCTIVALIHGKESAIIQQQYKFDGIVENPSKMNSCQLNET